MPRHSETIDVTNNPNLPKLDTATMYDQLGTVLRATDTGTTAYKRLMQILVGMDDEGRLTKILAEKLESLVSETESTVIIMLQLCKNSEKNKAILTTEALTQGAQCLKWLIEFIRLHNSQDKAELLPLAANLQKLMIQIDDMRKSKISVAYAMEEHLEQVRKDLRRSHQINKTPNSSSSIEPNEEEPIETIRELLDKARSEVLSKEQS